MPNIYIVFKNEKETGIVYVKDLYFLLRNIKTYKLLCSSLTQWAHVSVNFINKRHFWHNHGEVIETIW